MSEEKRDVSSNGEMTTLVSDRPGMILSESQIVSYLQSRYRSERPYSQVGSTILLAINPLRIMRDLNDESAESFRSASLGWTTASTEPHPYNMAGRVYTTMCLQSTTQAVIYNGISGSGKSTVSQQFTAQLLRLSADGTKKSMRLASQVQALEVVLSAFGCAKTSTNASASRFSRCLELHFGPRLKQANAGETEGIAPLIGVRVLAFGLERARLVHLEASERTFNVFYQLLAGATPQEALDLGLRDSPGDYDLLDSSGCLKLPAGPRSDDAIACEELRDAFRTLLVKPKNVASIFSVLIAILELGNVRFDDRGTQAQSDETAWITAETQSSLEKAAKLLGVTHEELAHALTNKLVYVRGEACAAFLSAVDAAQHRDSLVTNLYAIVFAYLVESINSKLALSDAQATANLREGGATILQIDLPGFQSHSMSSEGSRRRSLLETLGRDGYEEFRSNVGAETLQHWHNSHRLGTQAPEAVALVEDGLTVPDLSWNDTGMTRVEMLRGGPIGSKADERPSGLLGGLAKALSSLRKGKKTAVEADATFVEGLREHYKTSSAYVAKPVGQSSPSTFGIKHASGTVAYDAIGFVASDLAHLDADFVTLLRSSTDSLIAKLFSGPGLAVETHALDPTTLVAAQVLSQPYRTASPVKIATGIEGYHIRAPKPMLEPMIISSSAAQLNAALTSLFDLAGACQVWSIICVKPNDESLGGVFDVKRVGTQISAAEVPHLLARQRNDLVYRLGFPEYASKAQLDEPLADSITTHAHSQGWIRGETFEVGESHVFLCHQAWRSLFPAFEIPNVSSGAASPLQRATAQSIGSGVQSEAWHDTSVQMEEHLLAQQHNSSASPYDQQIAPVAVLRQDEVMSMYSEQTARTPHSDDWAWESKAELNAPTPLPTVLSEKRVIEETPTSRSRRAWLNLVWFTTWWIPDFALKLGGMKRPDVRLAWREKFTLCTLIFLLCAITIFYIIGLGHIICPNFNKAWNAKELGYHQGEDDYWVAVRGTVYDLTKFWRAQHSDIVGQLVDNADMLSLAGQDLTNYFPIPFTLACPDLITDPGLVISYANFTPTVSIAVHTSGALQPDTASKLHTSDWYTATFLSKMDQYKQGPLVYDRKALRAGYTDDARTWAVYRGTVFDLSDYFYTGQQNSAAPAYQFLPSVITNLFQEQPGGDITHDLDLIDAAQLNSTAKTSALNCMNNLFAVGQYDFRNTARCQVQNYLLLAFSCMIVATIGAKFLAALQLGSKRQPEQRDKFVILQVPCYTEGEDSLRKTIESLAALQYDDKRKLMVVICDGMIIGSGNDRPTPRIVLDILGVDPKHDPDPLLFKSVGEGSRQLNYGKVYSGLYEFEGHVMPYLVIVKVGKPSERSRPGNRGKRDSQVLFMRFLNRVHFNSEMAPLELELHHQIKNVIGVDPQLYEFMLCVDADTEVAPDSLNRMVAVASDDSQIIGLCGETKLGNEQQSWVTMVQVYEYYISHHLTKAFESLFGSVTCLPGCFTMYRLRTNDTGRPLFVSSLIIDDYSEGNVDTLHKKNLLSLGEDRYLTTLILKHFPNFKTKFSPDAQAMTIAPDRWEVLLSQRRRWINSTVHNLFVLTSLKDLCGFCCFSMRFIVLLDLVSTVILPASSIYLVYMIITVATGNAQIPVISLIMIGAVYGLQAIVFLVKRQWQFIGWLVIYLLAYPIYSFFLPLYSFWHFDDFSWGNTRIVVGEGKKKKILATTDDEPFDDSMIPLRRFGDYQAEGYDNNDWDMKSEYSRRTESVGGFSTPGSVRPTYNDLRASRTFGSSFSIAEQYDQQRRSSRANLTSAVPAYAPFAPIYSPSMGGSRPPSEAGSGMSVSRSRPNTQIYGLQRQNRPIQLTDPFSNPRDSYVSLGMGPPRPAFQNRNSSYSAWSGMGPNFARHTSALPMIGSMPITSFIGQSASTDPTDEEITQAVRMYLSTQDLMRVTKRSTRDALADYFIHADLTNRKALVNQVIDRVLSGQL
ncbi:glycosyltransferase family 2 protein [Mixia osmundae IAM 14324]|uniref:chitin synthase n=1 Tax=Mixia osmundae (strain CBS 9802 / IAM 14324 / JCM 22182 / KY 12970) TaxID=764103 RepID=G7DZZ3_MIXOS|nr:glycosyltransferase family 2 protein [Mixia osmundae IAM 14324]KEI42145.1 glycosyltransferase family 2 protein [Mixia osmundae IAM 14324]GAA96153.1 hypothetical protein E5Q_02814 [Mixia osmundae IAM 14324]